MFLALSFRKLNDVDGTTSIAYVSIPLKVVQRKSQRYAKARKFHDGFLYLMF